jgi:hypothetical protein
VTPPGQVPAPERDERGLWRKYSQHELSRQNIVKALSYAAQYIHERGQNATVVAVGGAVNTVYLQTRNTTHDVDFFCPLLTQPTLGIVREAGRYAVERSSVPLAVDWLNNATARMPGVVEAIAQNDVLVSYPGLTVVAAPWNYAFIKKVSRISQGTARPYDSSDAATYLHEYITKVHSNKPVPLAKIQTWGVKYKALSPVEILKQIDELYRQTYGVGGILFSGSGGSGEGGSSRAGSSRGGGAGASSGAQRDTRGSSSRRTTGRR